MGSEEKDPEWKKLEKLADDLHEDPLLVHFLHRHNFALFLAIISADNNGGKGYTIPELSEKIKKSGYIEHVCGRKKIDVMHETAIALSLLTEIKLCSKKEAQYFFKLPEKLIGYDANFLTKQLINLDRENKLFYF